MATHWIDAAKIDGFRSIRDLHLEGLGGLNVLVGENNSGKTSVLEALSILASFSDPSEWLNMVGRRDFGRLDETRAQSIRWCFDRSRVSHLMDEPFQAICTLSCRGRLGTGILRVKCGDITSSPQFRKGTPDEPPDPDLDVPENRRGIMVTHEVDFKSLGRLSPDAENTQAIAVWDDDTPVPFISRARRDRPVETETLNPYSYQLNRLQVRRLSGGKLRHSLGPVLSLLREFDPEITDIEIGSLRGGRPSIYITHSRLGSAPLSIFGDALRRAVLLATTIQTFENGGILFIDEIETGIHVHALQRVFAWLAKVAFGRDVQIFVTTHSLEAVDAIVFSSPDAKKEVVAFHLEQTAERTTAKRFDGDLLSRLRRERGIDVR